MKTKILSLLLVFMMAFSCFACASTDASNTNNNSGVGGNAGVTSNQLEIVKSDAKISIEDRLDKIKAEYLLENGGYKSDDPVVAIVTLKDDSIVKTFTESNANGKVGDFANSPVGKNLAGQLTVKQNRVARNLLIDGLIDSVEANYTTILNGFAVNTTYENIAKLEKRADIESVILSDTFARPKAVEASAIENVVDIYDTGIFKPTGVDYTGVGTSVAVLDSGFDCSHSVFNDHPVSGATMMFTQQIIASKLPTTIAAQTTKNIELTDVWYSNKIPFTYDYAGKDTDVFPYDSEHGTHVAGIIGGEDTVIQGIAPDTQLVLMKVFPDIDTGGKTEDILCALEDAVKIGVDAINMSLGASCGFAREADNDHLNDVYDSIYEAGISLITAASNDYSSAFGGAEGNTNKVTNPDSGTVGSPSSYEAALSVASISGTKSNYIVANGSQIVFFNESNDITGDPNDFFAEIYEDLSLSQDAELELEYVTVPGVGKEGNYNSYPEGYFEGKVALVRRGDNTFEDKALQAKRAGAVACIIYNNIEGDILMSMGKTDHIPTVSISKTDGEILAEKEEGVLKITLSQKAGPFMSDFSSWGPTPSLGLKPEITAHGGNIKSSVPGGGYDEVSGTSMATPNLCGLIILIRQYLKDNYDLTPKQMTAMANQLMMSTATIVLNQQGNAYSPRKQGAGLASLKNSVTTRAYLTVDGIEKTKLELGDDPQRAGVYEMKFNVKNLSSSPISYNLEVLGLTESVSTSDEDFVAERSHVLNSNATYKVGAGATLSGTQITVSANATASVTVTYVLSAEDKAYIEERFPYGMYVEGFVKLLAVDEQDVSLNIPFLAFYGDWSEAPMFDKTFYEVESEAHDASIDDEDKIKADYVATTPYGSYYYNYIIPLGSYLYDVDTSKYDAIPASEDKIAISDYLGTIDGIYSVYTGLLRSAKTMEYVVRDKVTGEVVWSHTDYNARKAYYSGTQYPYIDDLKFKSAMLGLTNNREYTFTMMGKLDYENDGTLTNKRNSFSFDFTLDNEAPVIKEVTYEKEYDRMLKKDRYYLNMTVYDNHYVQSVYPIAFSSSSSYTFLTDNPIPVYGEKGGNTTFKFEITDMLDDLGEDELITNALAFSVEDYALNSNIFLCQLPGTKGDFKFTSDGTFDGVDIQTINAYVGEVIDLTPYLATSDATFNEDRNYFRYLTWTSSNEKKVEIDQGYAKCLDTGRILVTVTEGMDGKSAIVTINVKRRSGDQQSDSFVSGADDAEMKKLRFSYFDTVFAYSRAAQTSEIGETGSRIYLNAQPTVSFYPGEQIKLYHQVDPWYAEDNYKLTYKSSNPLIAEVDENGKVIAKKEGRATITLSVEGSNIETSLRVVVKSEFVIENRQLIAYKGLGGKVVIPDDEGILYISAYAFCLYDTDTTIELPEDDYDANKIPATNTTITEVVVPDGVEYIEKYAFYNCTGLKKITIPSSVKFIREYAFFNDAKLEEIDLSNIEAIGARAFEGCENLKVANLSKTYSLGVSAFKNCTSLESVDLTALRNTGKTTFSGCTALASVTLGEHTKLAEAMFVQCGIENIDIYERDTIPDFCFAECANLKTVTIHNDLVSVGYGAFCELPSLESVTFAKVERIENQAFYLCPNLKKVALPDSAFTIGEYAFFDCSSIDTLVFGANTQLVTAFGPAFKNTAITTFEVDANNPHYTVDGNLLLSKDGHTVVFAAMGVDYGDYVLSENITHIASGAFSGVKMNSLTVLGDLTIGEYAFADSDTLTSVIFPADKQIVILPHAFNLNKKLVSVTNLTSAKQIGEYAFSSTAIENVEIASGATVGDGAFYRSGVKTVTIGKNSTFGIGAFRECPSLTTVNMPSEGGVVFGSLCFAQDTALQNIDLSNYSGKIADQTFYACTALKAVTLSNVTEIGAYAFADCSTLSYVDMPVVEKIYDGAFSNNDTNLMAPTFNTIILPETLTYLGEGVFMGCMGLTEVEIPSSLDCVPDFSFTYCSNLQLVRLAETVKTLGQYAFAACMSLTSVNTESVEYFGENCFVASSSDPTPIEYADLSSAIVIGGGAFAGTYLTGDFYAPNLVEIGAYAFQNTYIYTFDAPVVESICEGAFDGNRRLKCFAIPETLVHLEAMAFVGCTSLTDFVDAYGNATAVVNDYLKIDDGVIYTVMESGNLLLSAVPSAKQIEELVVLEGTARIDVYAGNENQNVVKIVLPDSLKLIGNYAFYGYKNLKIVEFKSVNAPALESFYDSDLVLEETDPGYGVMHPHYGLFEWELCYYNFKGAVGKLEIEKGQQAPIKMILPANEDVVGYDGIVYEGYFGKVESSGRSNYVAMENNMINFLDKASQVASIGEITLQNEKLVNDAIAYLNAITQDPANYDVDLKLWKSYVTKVTDAKAKISALKLAGASKEVQDIQREINDFDKEVKIENIGALVDLKDRIEALLPKDRAVLDLTEYYDLLALYNEYCTQLETEVAPVVKDVASSVANVAIPVATATASLGAILFAIIKKRWFI